MLLENTLNIIALFYRMREARYVNLGFMLNGKEVNKKDYKRTFTRVEVVETEYNIIAKNTQEIVIEAKSNWGIINQFIVECMGVECVYSTSTMTINKGGSIQIKAGNLVLTITKH